MQGAFAEMDDDIGWNDFALRNYDPQIGRWVQQDPFQQFASPYLGMGNDPVNLIDPSGGIGIPCPGTSALSIFLENAVYAIGNALNLVSPVFDVVGKVAAVTQTATVVINAVEVSNTVNGQLGTNGVGDVRGAGKESAGAGSATSTNSGSDYDDDWQDLYKSDLIKYYKEIYKEEPSENDLGKVFELKLNNVNLLQNLSNWPLRRNTKTFDDANDRNTEPDYVGDALLKGRGAQPSIRMKDAIWVEFKQKGGGVYLSTSDWQIEGHMQNLKAKFAAKMIEYLNYEFRPKFVLITTADVKVPRRYSGIKKKAMELNIAYSHYHAQYIRKVSGNKIIWKFRFKEVDSW